MSIHRIRLFHSTQGAQAYHDWLETWLTNMQSWDADEVTNTAPTERDPLADGASPYYSGDLAFAWSEDRAVIEDQLSQYAAAYCDWYRLGYHVCTHDEDEPQPCTWDSVNESGVVPDHILEL